MTLFLNFNVYYIYNKSNMRKYININYPFKNSDKGFFLDLTSDENTAIRADLLHLILTRKGQRLYNPRFGTRLLEFIYEPNDSLTFSELKTEIIDTVKLYLPQLTINDLNVEPSPINEYVATLTIDYTINQGVFENSEIITINL